MLDFLTLAYSKTCPPDICNNTFPIVVYLLELGTGAKKETKFQCIQDWHQRGENRYKLALEPKNTAN